MSSWLSFCALCSSSIFSCSNWCSSLLFSLLKCSSISAIFRSALASFSFNPAIVASVVRLKACVAWLFSSRIRVKSSCLFLSSLLLSSVISASCFFSSSFFSFENEVASWFFSSLIFESSRLMASIETLSNSLSCSIFFASASLSLWLCSSKASLSLRSTSFWNFNDLSDSINLSFSLRNSCSNLKRASCSCLSRDDTSAVIEALYSRRIFSSNSSISDLIFASVFSFSVSERWISSSLCFSLISLSCISNWYSILRRSSAKRYVNCSLVLSIFLCKSYTWFWSSDLILVRDVISDFSLSSFWVNLRFSSCNFLL